MSWVISKKDNCILEGFKRIFNPQDIVCANEYCDNIICYYFDQQQIKILCVCDKIGKKLSYSGLIKNKSIYCHWIVYQNKNKTPINGTLQ